MPHEQTLSRADEDGLKQPTTSRIRWLLVSWLFVLSAVAFLDRVNLSVAGAQLSTDYHLSNVQFGALSTAFLLGYALFQTPAGWLADKWGPRRVLTVSVFWWGIFTALTAAVPTSLAGPFVLLLLIRFLLGVGEAIVYPASNQFIARWIPTQERGVANGSIFAGVGVGSAATPSLVTYMMVHHGWRYSFWICALIGVLVGLVWLVASRDKPEQHPLVSAAELSVIREGLTLVSQSEGPGRTGARATPPWLKILTSREVWAMTLSYFSYGYVAWIFFAWFFRYLAQVRGLNLRASAFYATLPFAAIAIGSPVGGLVSDWLTGRFGRRAGRCGIAVFAMALAGIFLAFGSNVNSAKLASVVLAGGAGALYLSQSSFWSVSADISGRFSGSVSGFMNMGAQIGGAVTAIATPAIAARFGWTASFLVAATLSLLGAFAWLAVNPNRTLAAE
jgi:MFS transporter, ACS family, glucarate transporter